MTARPGKSPVGAVGPLLPPDLADLLARPTREQQAGGYWYTVHEIAQQPETWVGTAQSLIADRDAVHARLTRAGLRGDRTARAVILTGSGSSVYVGEASARWLQRRWQAPVTAVASGEILTHLDAWIPDRHPGLIVSFARSGDSPESAATLDAVLSARPAWEHLIITCNGAGRLATEHSAHPSVHTIVLDSRTCDRSLVMTSSFTNMVVAAQGLAALDDADDYQRRVAAVADIGRSRLCAIRHAREHGAAAVHLRDLPRQRRSIRRRSRGRSQDAGNDGRRRPHDGRDLPRPAPRTDVSRPRRHAGRVLPVGGSGDPRLRGGSRFRS